MKVLALPAQNFHSNFLGPNLERDRRFSGGGGSQEVGLKGRGSQEVGLEGGGNQEVCLEGSGSQDPVEPKLCFTPKFLGSKL